MAVPKNHSRQHQDTAELGGAARFGRNSSAIVIVLIAVLGIVFLCVVGFAINSIRKNEARRECVRSDNTVYEEETGFCREKTIAEKFDEACSGSSIRTIEGISMTCAEMKERGLEKAFLDNTLVRHGDMLYAKDSKEEIAAGKQAGDYCLSAQDTWSHIGEVRCVVFRYEYLACSNGYCFLDEKKNYTSGFVAFFGKYNMYNWNSFSAEYQSGVSNVLVCGQIYSYQGHPEIKIGLITKMCVY